MVGEPFGVLLLCRVRGRFGTEPEEAMCKDCCALEEPRADRRRVQWEEVSGCLQSPDGLACTCREPRNLLKCRMQEGHALWTFVKPR